jgi:hypothetical protein
MLASGALPLEPHLQTKCVFDNKALGHIDPCHLASYPKVTSHAYLCGVIFPKGSEPCLAWRQLGISLVASF